VSTYVWMRLLESAPQRYDFGIRLLSLGHINRVYDRVAGLARGPDVLDLGCGTGNMAVRLAGLGLRVTGVDLSPEMLDVARRKIPPGTVVRLMQTSAMELVDHFPAGSFDTIVSILLLSELSEAEQRLALRQCCCLLRPGGRLILADEVPASTLVRRMLHNLVRMPLCAVTYVLTQASTSPVVDLEAKLVEAGFMVIGKESDRLGDFALVEAEKREACHALVA
jgi:ubiquinone/menaquinone biosynthesis C-methylase UbiE